MKLNEVFPSNYIKADDLQGREPTVVIANAVMEMLGNEQKMILYFQHKDKGMVCNKTNANRIAYLYGEDTDGWIGREIILCSEFVEFQGKTVKGLRVKPPARASASPMAPASAPRPAPLANRVPPATAAQYTELNPPPHDDVPF